MMKKRVTNYIKARVRSFEYALNGIYFLFIDEPNAIVQAILAIVALVMGVLLRISSIEWIILCLVIGLVLAMEAVNSAIENLADFASNKRIEESIKKTKDLSAAAVLFTSITALITGLIVFLPKLLSFLF
ncbi:MAG TPA: diacylglycerol kinase family protein [Dysgonamonadaceae bacterium]|nr:diacylglycerol kinase family protein [Dysgonamonadaceae bacterium]